MSPASRYRCSRHQRDPTDLIERVDVLTGAASAVYGADGVSGVVNFVLKRDFNGIAARAANSAFPSGGTRPIASPR